MRGPQLGLSGKVVEDMVICVGALGTLKRGIFCQRGQKDALLIPLPIAMTYSALHKCAARATKQFM